MKKITTDMINNLHPVQLASWRGDVLRLGGGSAISHTARMTCEFGWKVGLAVLLIAAFLIIAPVSVSAQGAQGPSKETVDQDEREIDLFQELDSLDKASSTTAKDDAEISDASATSDPSSDSDPDEAIAGGGSQIEDQTVDTDQSGPDPAPVRRRSRGGGGSVIDEIIVSAAKRNVQADEIAVPVSTVGEEALDFGGVKETEIIQYYTPNVSIYNEPSWSFVRIRGMGSGLNAGFEQSVAIIFDGVNMGRASFLTNIMLDVQQVEIWRGPQGTITGKNAIAGAYVVTSAAPDFEWFGKFDYGRPDFVENEEAEIYSAAISGPLIEDVLSFRIAAVNSDQPGTIYNTTLTRFEGDELQNAQRVALTFRPSEILDWTMSVSRFDLSQDGPNHQLKAMGDSAQLIYPLFDEEVEADPFNEQTARDNPGFVRRESWVANSTIKLAVSDQSEISLIAGWASQKGSSATDADWGPAPIVDTAGHGSYEQFSVELNLASQTSDEEFSEELGWAGWVAGLFFFRNHIDNFGYASLFPSRTGLDPELDAVLGDVVIELWERPDVEPAVENVIGSFEQVTYSYAGYFEAGAQIIPRTVLSVGGRFTYEEKELDYEQTLTGAEILWPILIDGLEAFTASRATRNKSTTGRISVQYFPEGDWGNFFLTYATGWKAGGFNADASNESELEFGPERSYTIELGAKMQVIEDVFGTYVTLFYSKFDDLQVSSFNGLKFVVGNAASSLSQGVEFEAEYFPFEEIDLTIGGQISYLDAHYISYPNGPCIAGQEGSCDQSGSTVAGSPPVQEAASITWTQPLGNWGVSLVLDTSAVYNARAVGSDDQDPLDDTNEHWLIQGRVGLKDDDDLWHIYLGCSNCNEAAISGGFDVPIFDGTHAAVAQPPAAIWEARLYGRF